MTLRPPGEFRRGQYDTDAALELFENLLLAAARIPVEDHPATHPLVLVQAAKALVGLRPHEPSRRLIDFALDRCPELPPERPVGDLKIPLERLGTTVAVFELEDAVESGDLPAAREQLGRLLLVLLLWLGGLLVLLATHRLNLPGPQADKAALSLAATLP